MSDNPPIALRGRPVTVVGTLANLTAAQAAVPLRAQQGGARIATYAATRRHQPAGIAQGRILTAATGSGRRP